MQSPVQSASDADLAAQAKIMAESVLMTPKITMGYANAAPPPGVGLLTAQPVHIGPTSSSSSSVNGNVSGSNGTVSGVHHTANGIHGGGASHHKGAPSGQTVAGMLQDLKIQSQGTTHTHIYIHYKIHYRYRRINFRFRTNHSTHHFSSISRSFTVMLLCASHGYFVCYKCFKSILHIQLFIQPLCIISIYRLSMMHACRAWQSIVSTAFSSSTTTVVIVIIIIIVVVNE